MVSPHGLPLDELLPEADESLPPDSATAPVRHGISTIIEEEHDGAVLMQQGNFLRSVCGLTDLKAWLDTLPTILRSQVGRELRRRLQDRQGSDERCLRLLDTYIASEGSDVDAQLPHYVEVIMHQFLQDSGMMGDDSQVMTPTALEALDDRRRRTASSSASLPPGDVNFWARDSWERRWTSSGCGWRSSS